MLCNEATTYHKNEFTHFFSAIIAQVHLGAGATIHPRNSAPHHNRVGTVRPHHTSHLLFAVVIV